MNNITVIIPIHEFNETISNYLDKAIETIEKQEGDIDKPFLIIVHPESIRPELHKYTNERLKNYNNQMILNNGNLDSGYQKLVNVAVDEVTTEYFTVLEFDDELGNTYFRNAEKYIKAYPEIDIFLTIMIEVNEKNEGIKLTNETVWAQQFVGENGEMGYLNLNSLKQYSDFKLSGAIIKKSDFINIGKYKSNIKLTFMYEFLLRALNNASKIFSIPRIGYKHLATREGSMFDDYQKNMLIDERKFWFETAGKEANFINDRPIDTSRLQKIVVSEK